MMLFEGTSESLDPPFGKAASRGSQTPEKVGGYLSTRPPGGLNTGGPLRRS